ncbi:uncharacterized protein [Palaemon carinicauda]|uniref:uncharacterized protein n=1 Tax=Palaemon carinicauda TaxID=392227 RepID=UPI0035B5E01B
MGKPKGLKWDPLQEVAFCNTKNAISNAAALAFPITHALLSTDACDFAIGAVFEQVVNGSPHLFCRKLSYEESAYFTFNHKLLAVHFATSLKVIPFVIYTKHMPLVQTFT